MKNKMTSYEAIEVLEQMLDAELLVTGCMRRDEEEDIDYRRAEALRVAIRRLKEV